MEMTLAVSSLVRQLVRALRHRPCIGTMRSRWRELIHPDDLERYIASDEDCGVGADHYAVEYQIRTQSAIGVGCTSAQGNGARRRRTPRFLSACASTSMQQADGVALRKRRILMNTPSARPPARLEVRRGSDTSPQCLLAQSSATSADKAPRGASRPGE